MYIKCIKKKSHVRKIITTCEMNNPVIHVITAQQSDMLQSVTYRLVLWRKIFVKKRRFSPFREYTTKSYKDHLRPTYKLATWRNHAHTVIFTHYVTYELICEDIKLIPQAYTLKYNTQGKFSASMSVHSHNSALPPSSAGASKENEGTLTWSSNIH